MKFFGLILLLCNTIITYSQTIQVLAAENNEPVPFATVILINETENVYSNYANEYGVIVLPTNIDFDTAEFSCVGFKKQLIPKLKITDVIILEEETVILDEVVVTDRSPIILGEFDAKQKNFLGLQKQNITACYIENTYGRKADVQALLVRVDKVHQKTAVRIHFYRRYDYVQEYYNSAEKKKESFITFIPGEELLKENFIYYIEPQKKGIIEIDVSQYNIVMPDDGIFVAVECLGYYDNMGGLIEKASKPTKLEMHYTNTDNYCVKFLKYNYWRNINGWIKTDFKVFNSKPSKKSLLAPTFGLKVLGL